LRAKIPASVINEGGGIIICTNLELGHRILVDRKIPGTMRQGSASVDVGDWEWDVVTNEVQAVVSSGHADSDLLGPIMVITASRPVSINRPRWPGFQAGGWAIKENPVRGD